VSEGIARGTMNTVVRALFSRLLGAWRVFPPPDVDQGFWARASGFAWGACVIAVCTGIAHASARVLRITDVLMIFPMGVCLVAARFGMGPAVFTALGGVLAFDFLLLPPATAFGVHDLKGVLTLLLLLTVTLVIAVLTDQLRRQAVRAKRQADIERLRNALLSALSHDLKTPLTALVGASTALCEGRLDDREREDFTRMVALEAERLNRLVSNLLELTRLEAGKVTVKRVPQAIDEVIGTTLYRLERQLEGRRIETSVPEDVPLAAFDPVLLEQVFTNLLENAVKYTPAGTPIDISVRRENSRMVVDVADRGPGVPPGEEEKVFERLYRGDGDRRSAGGVGLGLTICRAIITAHDGKIWLENRPGGGAVFRFTLPAGDDATPIANRLPDPHRAEMA
jgi:K+-sensing histidine kinase KdpD